MPTYPGLTLGLGLDVPLFDRADRWVALNATAEAQRAASRVIDTEDLRDVLPLLTR